MDYTPTLGVKDTVVNVKGFLQDHKQDLKFLMKSVTPYLLFLVPILVYVNYHLTTGLVLGYLEDNPVPVTFESLIEFTRAMNIDSFYSPYKWVGMIASILIAYCFAVVAVSWHRLVILGRDNCEPMSVLKPQKHEKEFVIAWTMVGIIIPHIMTYAMNFSVLHIVISTLIMPYIVFKVSFYFPARAVGGDISFKDSFRLTKGYFWKFGFATIRVLLLYFFLYICASFVSGILGRVLFEVFYGDAITTAFLEGIYSQAINQSLITVLLIFYFQPLFTVLGVTVVSNYYLHAMQNLKDES